MSESRITNSRCSNRHDLIGHVLLCVTFIQCVPVRVYAQDATAVSEWHEPRAKIRFRIEKDDSQALIPNISLLDVSPDRPSEATGRWVTKHRWSKTCRVNGKLCLNFLPVLNAKPIVYTLHPNVGFFMARGSVIDGADPNTSVRFQVLTDKRPLFTSRPVTVQDPVVEIYVKIPPQSRQLRLVVKSYRNQHLSGAKWVDPGVAFRRQYPSVSSVRLFAPAFHPEALMPVVISPSDGTRVMHEVLSAAPGDPMDILFDSSQGNPSYLVYLVPGGTPPVASDPSWRQAGLVLETRRSKQPLRGSNKLSAFVNTFNHLAEHIGRSLVDDIQQTFPIHRIPQPDTDAPSDKGGYGLYHYQGFFGVPQGGRFTFATVSNWDSYVTINDKLVVAWPGRHGIGGGTRGQKQGTITLEPGLHKLDYYNDSPWGQMYALAAWKKPNERLRPMTRTDFLPVGRYRFTSVDMRDSNRLYAPFTWSILDDFRVEQTGRCLVTMQFEAIAAPDTQVTYRWTFDDGTVQTGRTVSHVFLRPALRRVQLEIMSGEKPVSRVVHDVYVHSQWQKMLRNLDNVETYDKAIQQCQLDKVPANDMVNVYRLAEEAGQPDWRDLATAALKRNLDRLVRESEDTGFMLDFGGRLRSAELQDYTTAVTLFGLLAKKKSASQQVRREADLRQAEVMIESLGSNQQALQRLNQLPMENRSRDGWACRFTIAKAEAFLALGQAQDAAKLIDQLAETVDTASIVKQHIKHAGLLRWARQLVHSEVDPNQLDHAMVMLDTMVSEDPAQLFAPNLNLVKLDIYLARREFQAAFFLAERLKHLQLNDYDRAEILVRQILACCGMRDLDKARSIYTQLKKDYPLGSAADRAKQAIIQVFGQ